MTLPTAPFDAIPMLFVAVADSDLLLFLREAHALLAGSPALIVRAEADLDAHGCAKKALRLADAVWRTDCTTPLAGYTSEPSVIDPTRLTLSQGRPRTPAYVAGGAWQATAEGHPLARAAALTPSSEPPGSRRHHHVPSAGRSDHGGHPRGLPAAHRQGFSARV